MAMEIIGISKFGPSYDAMPKKASYAKRAKIAADQNKFLSAYVEEGTLTHAGLSSGIDCRNHYRWMSNDPTYPARFQYAHRQSVEHLEREARRRAIEGTFEPTGWYRGEPGGFVKKYSDVLLIFLLKGCMPEKYKDRHELTGKDGGPVQIQQSPIALDMLPPAVKYMLVVLLKGGSITEELQARIMAECGSALELTVGEAGGVGGVEGVGEIGEIGGRENVNGFQSNSLNHNNYDVKDYVVSDVPVRGSFPYLLQLVSMFDTGCLIDTDPDLDLADYLH